VTEDQRLAQAVRDGDVSARAVYADWLEEHGDAAMATFVRAGGMPVTAEEADRQLDAVLDELYAKRPHYRTKGVDLRAKFPSTRAVLDSPQASVWLRATLAKLVRVNQLYRERGSGKLPAYLGRGIDTRPFNEAFAHLKQIASERMRGKVALDEPTIVYLLEVMSRGESDLGLRHLIPWAGMVGCVEKFGVTPAVRTAIENVKAKFFQASGIVLGADDKKIEKRLDALLKQ
jgi:uncharacterized protein (TIGR02996 family)